MRRDLEVTFAAAARRSAVVTMAVLGIVLPWGIGHGEAGAQSRAVDADASRILERMTDFLGRQERFSLDTVVLVDEVLVSGQKVQTDLAAEVVVRRPDRLHARQKGYGHDQELFFDGSSLTIYNHESNYWASADSPGSIDEMLHFARESLDIVPPTGDIVFSNAFELLTAGVTSGWVVGKALVAGVQCDHLAFTTPVVDWQIWIADAAEPLPVKYVLTTRDDPAQPQFIVLMSNWNLAPAARDSAFEFVPPSGAREIEFLGVTGAGVTGPAGGGR